MSFPTVHHLSQQQYGVVRRQQATAVLSAKQIRHLVAAGDFERPYPGILVATAAPPSHEQRTLTAVWAAGRGAVASHRSAAALWGLTATWPACPEVTVPGQRHRRLNDVVVHRCGDLDEAWLDACGPIPATGPVLTLVQLGAVAEPPVVASAMERGLMRGIVTPKDLQAGLRRFGRSGRDGAGVLRDLVEERGLGERPPDSVLEATFATLARRSGLPQPRYQYEIRDADGVFVARVDFAYPDAMLAIEIDGWEIHGRPTDRRRDLWRRTELELLGWMVIHFDWAELHRNPRLVVQRVDQILRHRLQSFSRSL